MGSSAFKTNLSGQSDGIRVDDGPKDDPDVGTACFLLSNGDQGVDLVLPGFRLNSESTINALGGFGALRTEMRRANYMGDHLFRQAVLRLPEPVGEKSVYLFIPPTADRPFHVQLQGMFRETWYSPLHATVWLDGDADGRHMLFYCFGISKAQREGRLELTRSDETFRGYRVINARSAGDLATLSAMSDFTSHVAEGLGAEVVRTAEHGPGAALHEFGGLRMGSDPDMSVTNPDGRFWRIGNLSCVDAAIWPHQGSANSYLTITAVSLRNASHLAVDIGAVAASARGPG